VNIVQPDSFLTLPYRLAGADGADVVSTFGDSPATLALGTGQLAPAIESCLVGLAEGTRTVIAGTRYGNVLASRGSVVPLFMNQVRRGLPITLTDPDMTRFIMTLDEAVKLCLNVFQFGENGDMFVRKVPAITIGKLCQAVLEVMGRPDHPIRVIGPPPPCSAANAAASCSGGSRRREGDLHPIANGATLAR